MLLINFEHQKYMKLLFDFFPVVIFFLVFKFFGIYYATAAAMLMSIVQVSYFWFKHHKVEIMHLITLVLILGLGGATLLSHNVMFIKWKPTAIYWIFALLFFGSQVVSKKPLIQTMMGSKITLPKKTWSYLNLSWVLFFCGMGSINLYVAYHFNTNAWVNFKLYGILGSTLLFGVLQSLYITRYLKEDKYQ